MKKTHNKCLGETLEAFLQEQNILSEVSENALKTSIALQIKKAMKQQHLTQTEVAQKMGTSRAVLQRLLNAQNKSVTLQTLSKAARAIGKELHISFK